ncbi:hybrid non-ribosomal peptide synthetase/type I polyketide synthase [Opitutus sp. ER46]|uniref:hybrid non-ribosomal peptide synthetase/type I polyketide synthase n=1 Tax=Opitutus sp. ER46 TaxID=2161864 RepID=UPI000D31A0C6|nr:hybrid non-ribosomal peptide synthetase/type I polyketide synthase [Opitutus sp. ER46]PTX92717.1 non-ribosomal peptide synthetase [Opitutus sp. ER46]
MTTPASTVSEAVAIVGLAGRFPRARNLDEFWRNLCTGTEVISRFGNDEVEWLPIEHAPDLADPRFVKARGVLEKPEWFDAAFFGINPREAAIMDPQHRVFLECAWEALEDAGCDPDTYPGLIGVFAGASMNTYLFTNLLTNPDLVKDHGLFASMILNDGDFVPTRVSYKLNLRGPSLNVQTACSTSLVAVGLAVQNLLSYRCDVALAGGVSITFPAHRGQHHLEGGIMSADGHCRAFDARASGTVLGDGAGIVVLKRLSEAVAEGDRIYAVIKGHAINNDGAVKIGYTAPSIDGQAECIAMAQDEAGVAPETISYVEAHGTGTPLGDPIEIAGLTKAFGLRPDASGQVAKTCAVGSVKSNIGHLDVAAGVAGMIKTVLALQHGKIPPSLHFETPNPKLELERTPFVINQALRPWPRSTTPRRAGVSSFGIGGTNAHVVLEEAPLPAAIGPSRRARHLLVVSAKTPTAVAAAAERLAAHLETHPEQALADVAFSLQTRRKGFAHRRAVVAGSREEAIAALRADVNGGGAGGDGSGGPRPLTAAGEATTAPRVTFMFPGQGAQYVGMASELYETELRFRATVDRCARLLQPHLGRDIRTVMFGQGDAGAADELGQTRLTQPALFVIEYALADLWMFYGIRPHAVIGHSLGEYVAACLAGVFKLEDALAIVAERARLMQAQPPGAMLAVRLTVEEIAPYLQEPLSLAATNARGLCVVSGPFDAITALEKKLGEGDVASRRLATSHAFHSAMMDGAAGPLTDFIRRFPRQAPQLPILSNVTGQWLTPEQAQDPAYWAAHLRQTVRFAEGIATLTTAGARHVLLEVGPGETLAGLARQCGLAGEVIVTSSLGRPRQGVAEYAALLRAVGQLWAVGAAVEWKKIYDGELRRFVALPTYPFERSRFYIEPGRPAERAPRTIAAAHAGAMPPQDGVRDPAVASGTNDAARAARDGATATAGVPAGTRADAVRALFAELSGVALTPADDAVPFVQLGFDSLFLTQASVALAKRFGVEVAFRQLREGLRTIAGVAAHLEAQEATRQATAPTPSANEAAPVAAAGSDVIPTTEAQRELWLVSQLGQSASAAYHESTNLWLDGELDRAALQRAFDALVARHEALRVELLPGGETQRIAPAVAATLADADLSALEPAAREARLRAFIGDELERPFTLEHGPLFRGHLVRLEPRRHLFLLVVHHVICDGWSLGTLQKELGELYAAEAAGRPLPPRPTTRYRELVTRQVQAGETPVFQKAEAYWLSQYADSVPALDLPGDRARPAERTQAGAFLLRSLPAELTTALQELAARQDTTLFTVLFAAFNVLLNRLSGQADVVVGIPAATQVIDGAEDAVGHFVNLLPVRNRVAAGQGFAALLGEVKNRLGESLEHWRYPFGRLLQRLNLPRDPGRVPLANVVFNSTRLHETVPFGPLQAEAGGNAKRFSHFDLNLNFALQGGVITLGAYYSCELFDEATVARWLGHYETLLRGVVAASESPVEALPLLAPTERDELLQWGKGPELPYDHEAVIADLFAAQVRRTPDAVALVAGKERLTYRELDARATMLAERLRRLGVGPGKLVGLCLERRSELLVAILGILKAGGAYVPLDPTYPADRLEFMVADAGMSVLVTQSSLVERLPAGRFDYVLVDGAGPTDVAVGAAVPAPLGRPTPGSPAYVIYTSGSTGRPKGVVVPQRAVVALVAWARAWYQPEELDGVLFATSAAFDISIFEIFCPLCLGGKLVMVENLLRLAEGAPAEPVRFLSGVPSALAEVVRLKAVPPTVTTVALAGEAFPQWLVEALHELPHIERVFELYGPTETTVYSTGGLRTRGTQPSLGRPFPNEQIYILDGRGQPVPVGVVGEIYVAGDKVALGYLNRPELTAARFVADPFVAGATMYRSGDLARWRTDGTIESVGRADHQLKVRGFRVELGEIEAVLAQHPAVAECVVVARQDAAGQPRLLAYAVADAGQVAEPRALREHLMTVLPEYMVPVAVQVLARWPLTANGKLDRNALPEPELVRADATLAAPRTTTEELLAEIWRGVLALDQVGVHDNFFERGGHSLLAAQVMARVRDAFEVELSLREFFAAPTIAGLAAVIESAMIREITGGEPGRLARVEELS